MSLLPHKETVLKEVKEVKSLFASRTFLAICFTAIASLAPIVGVAIKEGRLSVDNSVQIVLVIAGAGMATVGRASANNSLVYTEDWMIGANKSDFLPLPVEEGEHIEGFINNAGVASVETNNESGIASVSEQVD